MEYSFLKPIGTVTFGDMKEFTIEHYTSLIKTSTNPKQIKFLTNQIELLCKKK